MKDKRVRRILTIFIAIICCFALIPVKALLADTANDADFQLEGSTLIKYTGTATTVSIPASVKTIGKNAFDGNSTMTSVTISGNVKSIGNYAFNNCSALKSVVIGDSVTSIGNSAFADCPVLSSVSIGAKVNSVGSCAFGGCDMLSGIAISGNNTYLTCYKGALYGDSGKILYQVLAGRAGETYTMPDTVKTVKPYVLWGCDKIKTFSFSGGFSKIPEYAFYNATGLQFVEIPSCISYVDLRAFGSNYNLEEVIVPLSVLSMHDAAFEDCPKLKLIVSQGSYGDQYAIDHGIKHGTKSVYAGTYNYTLENANTGAGSSQSNQGSVSSNNQGTTSSNNQSTKPDTSTMEGAREDAQTSVNGDIDHLKDDELGMSFVVSGNAFVMMNNTAGTVHDGDDYTSVNGSTVGSNSSDVPEFLPDGTYGKYTIYENKVAEQAFYEDGDIGYYVIPEGVTQIGELSFARSSVSGIAIPNSVKKIGYGAFYQCPNLEYVTLPDHIETIEPYAFEGTKWKNDWLNGGAVSDFYIVGDGILLFYKGDSEIVEIPDGIKQIAAGCFMGRSEIKQVNLPDSIRTIGEEAFLGCDHLTTVNGGTSLEAILDRAFSGCPLDTIRIPATVKKIGLGAFDYSKVTRDAAVAVVFMGAELPKLSFESSATKLADEDARKKAFEQVKVAILWNQNATIEDTILWDENFGFSGFICRIFADADTNATGTLELVAVSSDAKKSDLPASVWVYGNRYTIKDTYGLLETIPNESIGKSAFQTICNEHADVCTIDFEAEGSTNLLGYLLEATADSDRETHLKNTVTALYGDELKSSVTTFSYKMWDESITVPITRLGNESMTITMSVPNVLSTDTLHIVTEDADGQIEEVPFEVSTNSGRRVVFTVNHFSPFAMFNAGEPPVVGENDPDGDGISDGFAEDGMSDGTGGNYASKGGKEISLFSIYCVLGALLLLIIATALWFTRRFHKIL